MKLWVPEELGLLIARRVFAYGSTYSNFLEDKVNDHFWRNQAYTPATTVYMSLHTADPGETGASECTGGSYARQSVAFAASSGGLIDNTANIDFASMPAVGGDGVVAIGFWDASSAGNNFGGEWLQPSGGHRRVFQVTDTTNDDIIQQAHGLAANDRIAFRPVSGAGSLPTGMTEGTLYYVIGTGITTDTFRVSTTLGGASINMTAKGSGQYFKVANKTVNSGDTFRVPTGDADVVID